MLREKNVLNAWWVSKWGSEQSDSIFPSKGENMSSLSSQHCLVSQWETFGCAAQFTIRYLLLRLKSPHRQREIKSWSRISLTRMVRKLVLSLLKLSNQHNDCPGFPVKSFSIWWWELWLTVWGSTTASRDKCNNHKH